MTLNEQALVSMYLCVLLIKACSISAEQCASFGFGESASGEWLVGTAHGTAHAKLQACAQRSHERFALPARHLCVLYPFCTWAAPRVARHRTHAALLRWICPQGPAHCQRPLVARVEARRAGRVSQV
eukprot:3478399-Prymnesium_polylepis.1